MPIPVIAYWCNQAIKYTNNRNTEIEEQFNVSD
nr:MAG TPA: vacuolar protein sorting-associated protein [Caudoviricetes sp.]